MLGIPGEAPRVPRTRGTTDTQGHAIVFPVEERIGLDTAHGIHTEYEVRKPCLSRKPRGEGATCRRRVPKVLLPHQRPEPNFTARISAQGGSTNCKSNRQFLGQVGHDYPGLNSHARRNAIWNGTADHGC